MSIAGNPLRQQNTKAASGRFLFIEARLIDMAMTAMRRG